jgi:uncharacterized protein
VKQFVSEAGSTGVRLLLADDPVVATSKVAYAEVHAAFARRLRDGTLLKVTHNSVSRAFDSDWLDYRHVDLDNQTLLRTRDLVVRHPLRGFDAIHLASALRLSERLGAPLQFVASDERLLAAAQSEGLVVVDVRR